MAHVTRAACRSGDARAHVLIRGSCVTEVQTRAPKSVDPLGDFSGPGGMALLPDYVDHWAARRPDRIALRYTDFSGEREGVEHTVTFRELDRWSRAIAARLAALVAPGDRVAILTPSSPEYMAAFAGTLRSIAIGVPLFEPEHLGQGERLRGVLADCRPTCLLTTAAHRASVEELVASLDEPLDAHIVLVEDLRTDVTAAEAYVRPELMPDELAYLQYTSGSTRAPAGVELTHRNVIANALQLMVAFDVDAEDHNAAVSWLPLFHDMGLVLGLVLPIVCSATGSIFDPLAFIQRPVRWMRELARQTCTYTAAPNFAYGYAAKRVRADDRAALDLSGVKAMLNGAEPVQPRTVRDFLEAFTPCGLRPEVLHPSYGLAEATVFVSTTTRDRPARILELDAAALQQHRAVPPTEPDDRVTELVSCGVAVGQRVAIVEPASCELLPSGTVGEVWVHGENVGQGYWANERATEDTFAGVLRDAGDLPERPWLRTGDLGVLIDGELYITGRMKDTIIIDGRNIYPNDVEATVEEAHPAIAAHRLAAFAVDTGDGECLVVVAEQHRTAETASAELDAITAAAKQAVSVQHAVTLHDFVLVHPHTVPRTSSGKIARQATRTQYLEGTLLPVGGRP